MSLPAFLQALWADGRVRAPNVETIPDDERREVGQMLAERERAYREELPGEPPPFHAQAAVWGAVMAYRVCQSAMFRQLGVEAIDRRLGELCPAGDPASLHYSVDWTLRCLPELWTHARSAAEDDPLVDRVARLAACWPLSSVGIPGVSEENVDVLVADPCLLRMYVDRIIARRDLGRLSDPRVREAVGEAIGMFPELAREVAAQLR